MQVCCYGDLTMCVASTGLEREISYCFVSLPLAFPSLALQQASDNSVGISVSRFSTGTDCNVISILRPFCVRAWLLRDSWFIYSLQELVSQLYRATFHSNRLLAYAEFPFAAEAQGSGCPPIERNYAETLG